MSYVKSSSLGKYVKFGTSVVKYDVLRDGNTLVWYSYEEEYFTKDASNYISQWNDKSGHEYHIAESRDTNKPLYTLIDGVSFSDVAKLKNYDIVTQDGFVIYMVMRQNSWASQDTFFTFADNRVGASQYPTSDRIRISGSADFYTEAGDQELGVWMILRLKFNGANSSIQVNNGTAITGSIGTFDQYAEGYLGSDTACADFNLKEFIYRNTVDDAATEVKIYNYLKSKYGL